MDSGPRLAWAMESDQDRAGIYCDRNILYVGIPLSQGEFFVSDRTTEKEADAMQTQLIIMTKSSDS